MPYKNEHPLHPTWRHIRSRAKHGEYQLCDAWNSFAQFITDVGKRPKGALLKRKDIPGPYAPDNVEWVRAGDRRKPKKKQIVPALYSLWLGMIGRCHKPHNVAYPYYGARGIYVCDRWRQKRGVGFRAFVADMGPRPNGYTLDRINNDGPYSPENCRWATHQQQQRNQRVNRWVEIDGSRYMAVELADQSGLKTDTIIARAEQGLSLQEVLSPAYRRDLSGLELGRNLTHCRRGHEYTEENTYRSPAGTRQCRACNRLRDKARIRA